MNLIAQGAHDRLMAVDEHVDADPKYSADNTNLNALIDQLKVAIPNSALVAELDCVIGALLTSAIESAYKFGVHDGFNIRDNVSALIKFQPIGGGE